MKRDKVGSDGMKRDEADRDGRSERLQDRPHPRSLPPYEGRALHRVGMPETDDPILRGPTRLPEAAGGESVSEAAKTANVHLVLTQNEARRLRQALDLAVRDAESASRSGWITTVAEKRAADRHLQNMADLRLKVKAELTAPNGPDRT